MLGDMLRTTHLDALMMKLAGELFGLEKLKENSPELSGCDCRFIDSSDEEHRL